ncbi:MAG: Glutamyl-tRNA(Gln) amidotransferase subunit C [candidate division WS6 bacterium OLB20]|uniref:Aspartyl/glutamyl-tRNA(Asn/Gln) amidotransferase subunit C n=1 Tax=candidate division WS6 bacterium OLB20 TaxID=1617426 RepID=A0A136LWI9_9BACT|nr:MAG: Glutamyl-tRNA(Gln) amidotransferase subunit C [candidate division WS6 bacterium OLB20]
MNVTPAELKKIADLARIELNDAELERFSAELSPIIDYAAQLREVDTSDISYASHVDDFNDTVLQEDVPVDPMLPEDTFKNSHNRKKGSTFITGNIQ